MFEFISRFLTFIQHQTRENRFHNFMSEEYTVRPFFENFKFDLCDLS